MRNLLLLLGCCLMFSLQSCSKEAFTESVKTEDTYKTLNEQVIGEWIVVEMNWKVEAESTWEVVDGVYGERFDIDSLEMGGSPYTYDNRSGIFNVHDIEDGQADEIVQVLNCSEYKITLLSELPSGQMIKRKLERLE